MKKKLLAISMAAALGGVVGSANAMNVSDNGVGLYNILPYYSVQEGNTTLIHITNTDTQNGKAVKVRFRGAEWSDDVFDFQVFLSPGDVWTGAVSRNGDVAKMTTTDKSCTLPANVNQDFITFRLVEGGTAGTREGYVEILTMADIPYADATKVANANSPLANAIKHVNGVPACGAVVTGLQAGANPAPAGVAPSTFAGGPQMVEPTGSLMSYGVVINVPASKAFTVPATALNAAGVVNEVNYFRQANAAINPGDPTTVAGLTADSIFLTAAANPAFGGTGLQMYQFDMPDLSTPLNTADTPIAQRDAVATALQRASTFVEYLTDDSLLATTDIVFNQPVRRFFYEYLAHTTPATAAQVAANGSYTINGASYGIRGQVGSKYAELNGASNRIAVKAPTFYDREEATIVSATDIVISPTPPSVALTYSLKGEASVLSINNGDLPTGSLGASLTANNYETGLSNPDGWATLSLTTPLGQTLPTIGFSAINVFNGAVGAAGTNYGMTLPLR